MTDNHYYFALYRDENTARATRNFQQALELARTRPEKDIIQKKINELNKAI